MTKIKPCLWFDNDLEDALTFYTTVFEDSEILEVNRNEEGAVFTAEFRLRDQVFMALNGGPVFIFNEAISFFISCEDQAEVDYYWDSLSEGGTTSQCGWTRDKYGQSWQIVPSIMMQLMGDADTVKAGRVVQAMMQMTKIDVDELLAAYDAA